MILRVTLLPEGTGKRTRSYSEFVPSVEEARVRWANVITLGIFVPKEKRFIAPNQIIGAEIVDDPE